MAGLLCRTLDCVAAQDVGSGVTLETIVVDDGSTDETAAVVDAHRRRGLAVDRVFRPRDARSCRARARNLGMERARGEVILFLDCGVLIPPRFVRELARRFTAHRRRRPVLVHAVLGLFAGEGEAGVAALLGAAPAGDSSMLCLRRR